MDIHEIIKEKIGKQRILVIAALVQKKRKSGNKGEVFRRKDTRRY